jgi:pimeloyl-ACP methyl ester carboxylesterase
LITGHDQARHPAKVIGHDGCMTRASPATVVLVHGAWHGAWCWERVTRELAAQGVPAVAIDLPGHGDDTGPLGDLHGDADRLLRLLDSLAPPVVLAGHSYGGAVITDAGTHPAVAHLVYLTALALDDGETCSQAAVEEAREANLSHDGRPDLAAGFIAGPGDTVTLDRDVARACLYHDCDPATSDWAVQHLGPQPLASLRQPPRAVAWRSRPATYIVCTDDQASHPGLQRIFARRCSRTMEWDTGHSPFLSCPARVADLLAGLARQA